MNIYASLQIGEYHLNYCEDYFITDEIGSNIIVCAVMDGCTTATDSHFASTLVGKILRKLCKAQGYKQLYEKPATPLDIEEQLRSLLRELFRELNTIKSQLLLNEKELLTTLLILIADKTKQQGIILAIGDGLVCVYGAVTEFDQDNKPDYIGFHLHENFDTWYNAQTQKICFDTITDISIATDGILTFTPVSQAETSEIEDPVVLLLNDRADSDDEDMLYRKLKKVEHKYGLKPTDDLAIVRIINK